MIKCEKEYHVINMCDFCANEVETCHADPIYSKVANNDEVTLATLKAVIACDKYLSPVQRILSQV